MRKVQRNVPIPPSKRGRASFYQFENLKIGESMLYPDRTVSQVNSAYQQFKKKNQDYKLIIRKEGEGCRIWRVETL